VAFQRLLALACPGPSLNGVRSSRPPALLDHDPHGWPSSIGRRYRAENCSWDAGAWGLELERQMCACLVTLARANESDRGSGRCTLSSLHLQSAATDLRLHGLSCRLLMVWSFPAASDLDAIAGADLLTTLLLRASASRAGQRLREDLRIVESHRD